MSFDSVLFCSKYIFKLPFFCISMKQKCARIESKWSSACDSGASRLSPDETHPKINNNETKSKINLLQKMFFDVSFDFHLALCAFEKHSSGRHAMRRWMVFLFSLFKTLFSKYKLTKHRLFIAGSDRKTNSINQK